MEVIEYGSLDQLLWTEADYCDFIFYSNTTWNEENITEYPKCDIMEWSRNDNYAGNKDDMGDIEEIEY